MVRNFASRLTTTVGLQLLFGVATPALGGTRFASGPHQVNLLELYSSEGCDSCPPAEAWLGTLKSSPGLWRDFVPVAFHVDYWDYLGWKDPFANHANSERQYAYAHAQGSSSAYTPELVLGGREWRAWRGEDGAPAGEGSPGVLVADLDGAKLRVRYRPVGTYAGAYTVHVARLALGIDHAVERGENRGKTLTHNFVAVGSASSPLAPSAGEYTASLSLPSAQVASPQSAVAVWITSGNDLTPIQATGGYLP